MDIHQLRFELCSGIRLPQPPHCPVAISNLIGSCFNPDPYQRPNFKNIKKHLKNENDDMLQKVCPKTNMDTTDCKNQYTTTLCTSESNNEIMRTRYMDIKQRNEKIQDNQNVASYVLTPMDEKCLSTSLHYLSLGNIPNSNEKGKDYAELSFIASNADKNVIEKIRSGNTVNEQIPWTIRFPEQSSIQKTYSFTEDTIVERVTTIDKFRSQSLKINTKEQITNNFDDVSRENQQYDTRN